MQKAKKDIVQITIRGEKYLFSQIEKQNDSGIMFNDRILFLVPDKHIGYVSDTKVTQPQLIPFQKAKSIVTIESIKSVLVDEKVFKIKYYANQDQKKVEKAWIFRAQELTLPKKWHDKIQYQKVKEIVRKQAPKPVQPQPQPKGSMIKSNSPVNRQKKSLGFSRAIELSENPKKMTQYVQMGTDPAEKQPQPELPPTKQIQTKEMGTIVTPRYEQLNQVHQKVQKKEFGTVITQRNLQPQKQTKQMGTIFTQRNVQPQKQTKQIGTVLTQRSLQPQKETKEMGTIVSQKSESVRSVPQKQTKQMATFVSQKNGAVNSLHSQKVFDKQVSKKDANFGTSFIQGPTNQKLKEITVERGEKEEKEEKEGKGEQEKEGKGGNLKKQDYTERSILMTNSKVNKSMKSEPVGNKILPHFYQINMTKKPENVQKQQNEQPIEISKISKVSAEEKQSNAQQRKEVKQKTESVIHNKDMGTIVSQRNFFQMEKQTKQIGTIVSQKSVQPQKATKEMGTIVSQKSESVRSVPQKQTKQMATFVSQKNGAVNSLHSQKVFDKQASKKDANFGTSFIQGPTNQKLKEITLEKGEKEEKEGKGEQKKEGKGGNLKKQDYTERSILMTNSKVNKSMKSEPVGNKILPHFYQINMTKKPENVQKQQNEQPIEISKISKVSAEEKQSNAQQRKEVKQKTEKSYRTDNRALNKPQMKNQSRPQSQNANKSINSVLKKEENLEISHNSKSRHQSQQSNKQNAIINIFTEPSRLLFKNYDKSQQNISQSRLLNNFQQHKQQVKSNVAFPELKDTSQIGKNNSSSLQKSSFYFPNASQAAFSQPIQEIQPELQEIQPEVQEISEEKKRMTITNAKYISPQQFDKISLSQSYNHKTKDLIKKPTASKSQSNNYDAIDQDASQLRQTPKRKQSNDTKISVAIKSLEDKKAINSNQKTEEKAQTVNKNANKMLLTTQQKSIKEEQQSFPEDLEDVPWVFKYVKQNQLMFQEYLDFTYDLMQSILKDLAKPKHLQTYSLTYVKDNIRYYEVKDIEVKIAFIELAPKKGESISSDKICNKDSVKILRNQFKNFMTLYECLQNSNKLKVPLICLHEMNGFLGSFKIKARGTEQEVKIRQIEDQLAKLKAKSKIEHNFYENHHKYLIKLDKEYYNKFKDPKNQYDRTIKFDCIFIQKIDGYLLPDLVADYEKPQLAILRKQLIQNYVDKSSKIKQLTLLKKNSHRFVENLSENVLKIISEIILQINNVSVYFFKSSQLSDYLHRKGINVRYLGYIYDYLVIGFQRHLFMSQMAARCCKTLFRKTLQDVTLQKGTSYNDIMLKVYDFFNCIVGKNKEMSVMWKVISSHCKSYFGVNLSFNEVNPAQFIICLIQNCKLDVIWQNLKPEGVFKTSQFFSPQNLIGVKGFHKIYLPLYNDMYRFCIEAIEKQQNQENYQKVMDYLALDKNGFPEILQPIEQNLKRYIALFITPQKDSKHLKIFQSRLESPSKFNFDIRLLKIKWELKSNKKEKYIQQCDDFLNLATKFYGEFHPVFSTLYDTFSAYYLSHDNFEEAITFTKSSLVNILKTCGSNHQKTAQSYFKLGVCYMKAKKADQAASNFKKAKKIIQDKSKTNSFFYAVILLKLALMSLNQNKLDDSLTNANKCLSVLEKLEDVEIQNELIQCYEAINRCYELKKNIKKLKQFSRQIQSKLHLVKTPTNLQKVLKIYLYPILTELTPQSASNYLDIITQLRPLSNQQNYSKAYLLVKSRISQGQFRECVLQYMNKINSIESYIRDANLLKDWQSFKQQYQRQTVNDFLNFTQELLCFLGEGFIGGSLKEAL